MQPNDLPLLCLPLDLSDEAAAQLIDFLHELTEAPRATLRWATHPIRSRAAPGFTT